MAIVREYGLNNKRTIANRAMARKRTERAIAKARKEGKRPATDRKLAEMQDRIYHTNWIKTHHS